MLLAWGRLGAGVAAAGSLLAGAPLSCSCRSAAALLAGLPLNSAVPACWFTIPLLLQARELRVPRGGGGVELERRTEVFNDKWVEEAAVKYLAKRNGQPGL